MDPIKRSITTWLYRLVIESPRAHKLLIEIYWVSEAFHHRFPWFRRPELVEDAELQLLMKQHFADEDNHAKYFRLAMNLKGETLLPPPIELDYLVQLAGAFWEEGILIGDSIEDLTGDRLFTDPQNLFVQLAFKDLSEKRANAEFHIWRDLAKTRDPETYAVLKRVVEDEDWHCHIFHQEVQKRLEDPVLGPRFQGVYRRLVKTAERVANRVGSNFLHHLLDHDLLDCSAREKRLVRLVANLQGFGAGVLSMGRAEQILAQGVPLTGQSQAASAS